jgi:hypothetical protein
LSALDFTRSTLFRFPIVRIASLKLASMAMDLRQRCC